MLSIPHKYSVSEIVGYLKGKCAIEITRLFGKVRKIAGENFGARGYSVGTAGVGEREMRPCIWNQEKGGRGVEQAELL